MNVITHAPSALSHLDPSDPALYRDEALWQRIQRNGMATDVSWSGPAREYAGLYRELA